MPPKNARKRAAKAPESNPTNAPISTITFGEEETPTAPTAPPSPTPAVESSYPLCPLLSTPERTFQDTQEPADPTNDTQPEQPEPQANGTQELVVKKKKLSWTEEMLESLVETLYEVFEKGGVVDNSFKKAIFELTAQNVRKIYKKFIKISQIHCKNKWADLKAK
jgi:hypothetical protein